MSTRAVTPVVAAPVTVLTPLQRPMLQRTCDCGQHTGGGECADCNKKKKMLLQRQTNGSAASAIAPPIIHDVLRSPGQPLDDGTQTYFASRFGHDFTHVRVHTDQRAAESARAVSAHAYTVGRHVVFDSGRYAPHNVGGRSLLSHELTHVVQQSAAPYADGELQIGEVQDAAEREADRVERSGASQSVRVGHESQPRVQGKWDWGRAGWGALAGLGIGGGAALLAAAAGAPGLAAGLLVGGIVGGFLIGGFTGSDKKPGTQPAPQQPPPGCTPDRGSKIVSGMRRGLDMSRSTIAALSALNPGARGHDRSGRASDALNRYFKSNARQVANYVRDRFAQIQEMLSTLQQGLQPQQTKPVQQQPSQQQPVSAPAISCHTPDNDDTCKAAIAYVGDVQPGQTQRDSMIFCSSFFDRGNLQTDDARGAIIIHEVAHAILGGKKSIQDRGYSNERFFPDLTTEEALTNADSYRMFALHVAGDSTPDVGQLFTDFVEECDEPQQKRLNQALRLAERWVDVAWKVTHDRRPGWLDLDYWKDQRRRYLGGDSVALIDAAAKAYDGVAGPLRFFEQARCHPKPDAVCPAGRATNTAQGGAMGGQEIQLCPDWLGEHDRDRQAILVLAELLGGAGVQDPQARLNHAEMAKQLFEDLGQAPSLEEILGPQPGDHPIRTLPAGTERA